MCSAGYRRVSPWRVLPASMPIRHLLLYPWHRSRLSCRGNHPEKMLGRSVDRTAWAGWITADYENLGSQRILARKLGRKYQGLPCRSTSGGNRTPNRRFWRPVLYQLSYARSTRESESRRGAHRQPRPISHVALGTQVGGSLQPGRSLLVHGRHTHDN